MPRGALKMHEKQVDGAAINLRESHYQRWRLKDSMSLIVTRCLPRYKARMPPTASGVVGFQG